MTTDTKITEELRDVARHLRADSRPVPGHDPHADRYDRAAARIEELEAQVHTIKAGWPVEVVRLRALVESAYADGWSEGTACVGMDGIVYGTAAESWVNSDTRRALDAKGGG